MTPVVFRPGGWRPWDNEEPPRRPDTRKLITILLACLGGMCMCSFISGIVIANSQQPPTPTLPPLVEIPTETETETPTITDTPTDTPTGTLTPTGTATVTPTRSLTPSPAQTQTPLVVTVVVTKIHNQSSGSGGQSAPVVITSPPVIGVTQEIIIVTATINPSPTNTPIAKLDTRP